MSNNFIETCTIGLVVVVVWAAVSLILGLPVMWLWNWLMPAIFGIKTITWIQAVGLSFLCSLLFKGGSTTIKK